MSAFMVGSLHIDALLSAGMHRAYTRYGPLSWFTVDPDTRPDFDTYEEGSRWREAHRRQLTRHTANDVGAVLLDENQDSVNYRYNDDELEEIYQFKDVPGYPDPRVVLQAIKCYEYQACEHPGWATSEAKRFCEALQSKAINILTEDIEGAWEVRSREVFNDYTRAQYAQKQAG
jgi:hypothetical protein